MADYDFRGLSTRSFEHVIQAIGLSVIGPGVTVFGDGPDGGREATFNGSVTFPDAVGPWSGYGIIQAKFKQRPSDSHAADLKWLKRELSKELTKQKRNKGVRPEYYIIATNVVLTAAAGGGKDAIDSVFKQYQRQLKLKGWRIWDYDQICRFLDAAQDIRTAYAAWITPGDVLAAVVNALIPPARAKALSNALTTFIAKELYADQFANLEQAGHSTDERVPLARVFVDLPVAHSSFLGVHEYRRGRREEEYFLSRIILAAKDRLDAASLDTRRNPSDYWGTGRFVLVGGPGQGKTTLGQFVCQVFRAAILREKPAGGLAAETRAALKGIVEQCESQGIELPKTKRFPLRITLSEFADALQGPNQALSLLNYIAAKIAKRSGYTVDGDLLRDWFSRYPWLIVLDGLDEVPPSSNRDKVLESIVDFWSDVAASNADVLVIATTRPQGYSGAFASQFYTHLFLRPLTKDAAFKYAKRLVNERYGNTQDRADKVMSRLRQAASHDATAKLMTSPLQVTIMATLVDQIGQPPQDRWRLFHDYYDVIFRREMERDIPAAHLLRERRKDIDIIHAWVALLLQVETERSGGAEAKLDAERFKMIVASRLAQEGYEGEQQEELVESIVDAAANRLVFLVGLQAGQIGFEIRSLQEFMAAEALMQGADLAVQERLEQIAPITSWRNVFLFAAGRCFADRQHLRDTIVTICGKLSAAPSNSLQALNRTGSRLAAELLADGVAVRQPRYAELLLRAALDLIDVNAFPEDGAALVPAYLPQYEAQVKAALKKSCTTKSVQEALSGWNCLLGLIDAGVDWALDLGRELLPADPEGLTVLLRLRTGSDHIEWILDTAPPALLYQLSPQELYTAESRINPARGQQRKRTAHKEAESSTKATCPIRIGDGNRLNSVAALYTIGGQRDAASVLPPLPEKAETGWTVLHCLRHAASDLSAASLAAAFRQLASAGVSVSGDLWRPFSIAWPVQTLIGGGVVAPSELYQLADGLEQGRFGSTQEWLTAEQRLRTNGVSTEDVAFMTDDWWPLGPQIAQVGAPLPALHWIGAHQTADIAPVFDLLEVAPEGSACQKCLARIAADWLVMLPAPTQGFEISAGALVKILRLADGAPIDAGILEAFAEEQLDPVLMREMLELADGEVWIEAFPYKHLSQYLVDWRAQLQPWGDRVIAMLMAGSESTIHRLLAGMVATRKDHTMVEAQVAALNNSAGDEVIRALVGHSDNSENRELIMEMCGRPEVDQRVAVVVSHLATVVQPTDMYPRRRLGLVVRQLLDRRRSEIEQADTWRQLELPGEVLKSLLQRQRRRDAADVI